MTTFTEGQFWKKNGDETIYRLIKKTTTGTGVAVWTCATAKGNIFGKGMLLEDDAKEEVKQSDVQRECGVAHRQKLMQYIVRDAPADGFAIGQIWLKKGSGTFHKLIKQTASGTWESEAMENNKFSTATFSEAEADKKLLPLAVRTECGKAYDTAYKNFIAGKVV